VRRAEKEQKSNRRNKKNRNTGKKKSDALAQGCGTENGKTGAEKHQKLWGTGGLIAPSKIGTM